MSNNLLEPSLHPVSDKAKNAESIRTILSYAVRYNEIDAILDEMSLSDDVDSDHVKNLNTIQKNHMEKISELFFNLKGNYLLNKGIVVSGSSKRVSFEKIENYLNDQEGLFILKPEYLPKKFSEITVLSNDEKHLQNISEAIKTMDKNVSVKNLKQEDIIDEFLYGGKISFGSSVKEQIPFKSVADSYDKDAYEQIKKDERKVLKPKQSQKSKLEIS